MVWEDKVRLGMKLLHEACEEKEDCVHCPFGKVCDIIMDVYWNTSSLIGTPSMWDIEKGVK